MSKKQNKVQYINGYTKSAWKSLVIKSLRIGWVNGLEEAAKNLTKSDMNNLLLGSLFEDVFPASIEELNKCWILIQTKQYDKLCSINTLHGRGYAQKFFDMADEAVKAAKYEGGQIAKSIVQQTSINWINPRVNNCLYTWYKIEPKKKNYKREPLIAEWKGMPVNILDEHTYEGKKVGRKITLLSGHYENHLAIGNRVMKEGWGLIRKEFLADDIAPKFQEQKSIW